MRSLLRDEDGQMLPFLAVSLLIMLLFVALGFGLSAVYLNRLRVRDALDAAATAALSMAGKENLPTYLGERRVVVRDEEGNIIDVYWEKTESGYEDRIIINQTEADAAAKAYFAKNMAADDLNYRLRDWNMELSLDRGNRLQVVRNRPNTEGVITSWEEDFPQWVSATVNARVEIPVPFGGIGGRKTMVVQLRSSAKKDMR